MFAHKNKLSLALLVAGAMVVGATVGSGCAIYRGDRSVVQPLALNKAQFSDVWYYQKTIVDAPYDAPSVFIGSTDEGYKIRWEITEQYLYAFTLQPNVRNADSTSAPVAAWPITKHFTVRYQINFSTGQPSNIVWEDPIDKPWYQRPHFRVAWERSVITDFSNFFWIYRMFGYMVTEWPVNVRPEQVQITKDYMDFVTEEIISPGIGAVISKLNYDMPVTAYRVKWRHSFLKAKPSTYTRRPMNDDQFEKFGFFRTTIINHHIDRGLVDWSYQYFANRHNVATKEEIDAGTEKPKQIFYYLSPGFPEQYKDTANLIAQDWNKAFQRALNRPGEQIVVLRENGYGLPQGQQRNMGDIRYKFLYWVDKPVSVGLLGYGPSFADIDTGEIISCAAYVYGATVLRVTNRFMLLYDMIKGNYTDEDLRNGKDYLDIVNNFGKPNGTTVQPLTTHKGTSIMPPAYQGFDVQEAVKFVKSPMFAQRNEVLKKLDRSKIQATLSRIDTKPELKWAMMSDELLISLFPNTDIKALKLSPNQEVKELLDSHLNPANMLRVSGLRKLNEVDEIYGKHSVTMASYVDPALAKFVEANKDKSRKELEDLMNRMIFRGTEAHEIGHTLGLRHNFAASADEPNYFPEYFDLKKKQAGNVPGEDKDPRHIWYYMYSSIMDYHGEVYGDAVGNGTYDHAAIMYAYGDLLELDNPDLAAMNTYISSIETEAKKNASYQGLFKDIKITKNPLKTFKGTQGETLFKSSQSLLHIEGVKSDGSTQTILDLTADDLSGKETIRRVHGLFGIVPSNTRFYADGYPFVENTSVPLKRRLYQFCSDELVGQNPYCNRFDSGSTAQQIVDNMIRRYDGSYPLRNWSRGNRFYRLGSGYFSSLVGQFSVISIFYQNWMFRVVNESSYDGSQEYYDQLAAVSRGLGFISRVIATPEPGNHTLDQETNTYVPSPQKEQNNIEVPIGVGRYIYSRLQQDEMGLSTYRFERIGTLYDKYVALMVLAIRDWGLAQSNINFFYVNFMDYFSRDDIIDMFTGAISGIFEKRFAMTTTDKMIQPNWHPVLQYASMYMAMTMLNSGFFGNEFTHYMTVAIKGSGDSWTPPDGSKFVSFTNTSNTRTFYAVQTDDGRSVAYKLVDLGKKYSDKLKELRAAQPTSAVHQAKIEQAETQLRWVETVLNMMKVYVDVFYDDN